MSQSRRQGHQAASGGARQDREPSAADHLNHQLGLEPEHSSHHPRGSQKGRAGHSGQYGPNATPSIHVDQSGQHNYDGTRRTQQRALVVNEAYNPAESSKYPPQPVNVVRSKAPSSSASSSSSSPSSAPSSSSASPPAVEGVTRRVTRSSTAAASTGASSSSSSSSPAAKFLESFPSPTAPNDFVGFTASRVNTSFYGEPGKHKRRNSGFGLQDNKGHGRK